MMRFIRVSAVLAACAVLVVGFAAVSRADKRAPESGLPFHLETRMVIPDVPWGPYADHFAVDVAGGRLFSTPQAAHAMAVFDTRQWKFVTLIRGIGNPHSVYFSPANQRLFVVDGQAGEVKVFDGHDYRLIMAIPLAPGPDGSIYDPGTKLLYVENGGDEAHMDHALLSAIDPITATKVADIRIDGLSLETMTIDTSTDRMYMNIVDRNSIAVIDLKSRAVVATWVLRNGHTNFAMALDPADKLLFVGFRDSDMHGSMDVVDATTGREIESLPLGGWVDSMSFDSQRRRIYASTGVGHLETFQLMAHRRIVKLPSLDTAVMAKTSLYSAELDRMFVAVPHLGGTLAQVLVFKPNP